MDWKNPFIAWAILTLGLAFTAYLLVLAATHAALVWDELRRAGDRDARNDLGMFPNSIMQHHARWFKMDLLFAAAVAAALIVYWR